MVTLKGIRSGVVIVWILIAFCLFLMFIEHAFWRDIDIFSLLDDTSKEHLNFSIEISMDKPIERFNISYDREKLCLSKTEGYVYPLQWNKFSDPIIIWEWKYSSSVNNISPDYSVIITAFDSLNVIEKVIMSVLKLTRGKWELIIVFDDVDDYCVDYIFNIVQNQWVNNIENGVENDCSLYDFNSNKSSSLFIDRYQNTYLKQHTLGYQYCSRSNNNNTSWNPNKCGNLQRILFIRAEGIWETSSNNLGMCVSSENTSFFIHIQDDMQMTQIGYNIHMVLPLIMFNNDILSVSSRCCTPIQGVFRKKKALMQPFKYLNQNISEKHGFVSQKQSTRAGRCGANIDKPIDFNDNLVQNNIFKESTNSNRGPWVVNASDMKKLNYFNERAIKLIFDIGHFHLRGMTDLHKHTGYFPLQFRADLNWGGTRRHRRDKTEEEHAFRKEYELWRNNRRDEVHAFLNISKNKYIANYDGKRQITLNMMKSVDHIWHFCQ